jgi:hypothetical protein
MRAQFFKKGHSAFTNNSVKMLQNSAEYRGFEAVAEQGARFRMMGIVSMVVFFVMIYADFMSALIRHTPFIGAAMAAAPAATHPLFVLVAFITAAWMHTGSWSATYDNRNALVNVAIAHLAASATLAVAPTAELNLPPFVAKATVSHPWPALVPFVAAVPVGFVLFYTRFTGFWKRKHVASSPYLRTAPVIMLTTVVLWWYLGAVVAHRHRTLAQSVEAVNGAIVAYAKAVWAHGQVAPAPTAKNVANDVWTALNANARPLYGALMAHTGALAVYTVLVGTVLPSVGEAVGSLLSALLPSPRTMWILVVLAVVAEGAYLHLSGVPFPSYQMTGVAVVLTGLLVRGYPAQDDE